jgi:hypothetical protein
MPLRWAFAARPSSFASDFSTSGAISSVAGSIVFSPIPTTSTSVTPPICAPARSTSSGNSTRACRASLCSSVNTRGYTLFGQPWSRMHATNASAAMRVPHAPNSASTAHRARADSRG